MMYSSGAHSLQNLHSFTNDFPGRTYLTTVVKEKNENSFSIKSVHNSQRDNYSSTQNLIINKSASCLSNSALSK